MHRLLQVTDAASIPAAYRGTPIGRLLAYQNLGRPFPVYAHPSVLVATCIDDRRALRLPPDFATTIRTAGPTLGDDEFRVALAVGVLGVEAIAIVAHDGCGLARLAERDEAYVRGLAARAGRDRPRARRHFADHAPRHAAHDEVGAALAEADRLRTAFPGLAVAALYSGPDHRLAVIGAA